MHGLLKRLHEQAAGRLSRAFAPRSTSPLSAALRAFASFAHQCPDRVLFKSSGGSSKSEAAAWNEWTFILFAMYMSSSSSAKIGRPVRAWTIETYISLLKGYLACQYDFDVIDRAPRLKRMLAELNCGDPLGLTRRKRRGLRRRHLRSMWKRVPEVQATSRAAVNAHALLVTAWQVLARGGELAPQVADWSPAKGPTRADLSFEVTRAGRQYAILWLRPLKKKKGERAQKVPQYIAEYDGGGSRMPTQPCAG